MSLDQVEQTKAHVRKVLEKRRLGEFARVVHSPLGSDVNYSIFQNGGLAEVMDSRVAQFVLIDGPYGYPGCRIGTLPGLVRHCDYGSTWFLHDALHDGELSILRLWRKYPEILSNGIYPVGEWLGVRDGIG